MSAYLGISTCGQCCSTCKVLAVVSWLLMIAGAITVVVLFGLAALSREPHEVDSPSPIVYPHP